MDSASSCGDPNEPVDVPGLVDAGEDEEGAEEEGSSPPESSKCKTTMATQSHRLSTCVDAKTVAVLDDVAIRCNRAIYIGSAILSHDVLHSLSNGKDPVRFWETTVVDKAFALATACRPR